MRLNIFPCILQTSSEQQNNISSRLGLALSEETAFLIVVENDGYSVEEYPCTDFGVKNFEGCYYFTLQDELYFCVRKRIHHFNREELKWHELMDSMEVVRDGPACVSLQEGTLITGGEESGDDNASYLSDRCVLVKKDEHNLVISNIGKLPAKLRHHTLTKVSDNVVVLCGGINIDGYETREVYLGSLKNSSTDTIDPLCDKCMSDYFITWTKLPRMREYRSGHFSMFVNNRLCVFGGGLKRDEKQHVIEVNAMQCGLELGYSSGMIIEILPFKIECASQYRVGKWSRRYMRYDISFADLVLSPDEKYAIIAGGETYGFGCIKDKHFHLTMNTSNLHMRSLDDKDKSLHTNNVLKMILSCNCLTPMYDDIDNQSS